MSGSSNALTIAADPTVEVNPLAAMNAGVQAARNVYSLRDQQGQQLWGQALQQATDENGNVDIGKAQALAARMGPAAAMAAQAALRNTSALRGEQINQGQAINTNITRAGVSLMRDSSDANVDATIDNLITTNPGQRQLYEAERQRLKGMSPQQRQEYSYQHVIGQMNAADQFISQLGSTTIQQYGGTSAPTTLTPAAPGRPATMSVGGGVAHTAGPETYYTPQDAPILLDANGQPTNDPTKAVSQVPRVGPRGPLFHMPPPGSVGGAPGSPPSAGSPPPIPQPPAGTHVLQNGRFVTPAPTPAPAAPAAPSPGGPGTYGGPGFGVLPAAPGPGASIGNGVPVASANPAFAPNVGSAAPPSPAVAGDVNAIIAGMNQARASPQGGTQQAFNAIQSGAVSAPAQSPAAPPPPVTPRGPPPAAASPTAGVITGMPTGREEATKTEQEADQKQFIADRAALPQRQTQEQNLRHAYDALKLVTTGKGTENASALRNLLVTAGIAGAATANDEAVYEIGRKYTERTIADAGNAGGTDTARALAAQSNPNVSLINPANLAFLRNDIGKVRQQMAAYMTAPDTTIGKGFGTHSANIASNTDYRGFNWDDYSPAEQKQIMKDVGPEGTKAHDALARAIGMGRAFWPQKGPGPIVPHSQVVPITPPPNMLAMAQPPQNALSLA